MWLILYDGNDTVCHFRQKMMFLVRHRQSQKKDMHASLQIAK